MPPYSRGQEREREQEKASMGRKGLKSQENERKGQKKGKKSARKRRIKANKGKERARKGRKVENRAGKCRNPERK
jgi:hypothetical protein